MNSTHLRFLPLVLFSLVVIFSVTSPTRAADVTNDFTDTNFRTCVCTALGTCPSIDDGDAAALNSLTCENQSITSLAGIQHLTALTTLHVKDNSINDAGFTPVNTINTLTDVDIQGNQITSLAPLSGHNGLATFGMGNNQITDLTPLSGKPLTLLHIWENPITDISPLGNAPNPQTTMQDLRIAPTEATIADLSPIQGMTALTRLDIYNMGISSLTGAQGPFNAGNNYNNLVYLDIQQNSISDISVLTNARFPALADLRAGTNQITDASNLNGMPNLTHLGLWSNQLDDADIAGLNNFPSVTTYNIGGNTSVTNITGALTAANFPSLDGGAIYIYSTGCDDADLSHITTNFPNLTTLSAGELPNVSDFSVINPDGAGPLGLDALQALYLNENDLTDISFVSSITTLQDLQLEQNNLSGALGSLSPLTNLVTLELDENSLVTSDLANLTPLTLLQTLDLNTNSITSIASLASLDNLTFLDLSENSLTSLTPVASGNANLTDFASGLTFDATYNSGLYADAEIPTHLAEVATLRGAGATVSHDMEDCDNGSDDDGDSLIDANDPYCYDITDFYIDYDTGSTAASCGTELTPCQDMAELLEATTFSEVLVSSPYEDLNIYVQGTKSGTENVADVSDTYPETAYSSVTLQPWGSTPVIDGGNLVIRAGNTTIDGFEIKNDATKAGIDLQNSNNVVIRNSYIHDMSGGTLTFNTTGTQIYNNIFANNHGTVDVGAVVDFCGGLTLTDTTDVTFINNTLYNNCTEFDIAGNNLEFGDIALIGLGAPYNTDDPVNTTIKQNLVYNANVGANTFYYDVDNDDPAGALINGAQAGATMTNATAAAHGTTDPHNFIAAANPFANISAISNYAAALIGFAFNLDVLSTYQFNANLIDAATPSTDMRGNNRPSGPAEPGALEHQTNTGGKTTTEDPCADQSLTPINLPENLKDIRYDNGDVFVTLNWDALEIRDVNADRKIDILFEYLEDKDPTIGIHEKKLKHVFTRYILQMLESHDQGDPFYTAFKKELNTVLYANPKAISNLLASIGIESRYSDWWPYLLLHFVKNDTRLGDLLLKSGKIWAEYLRLHGDISDSVLDNLKQEWETELQKQKVAVQDIRSCAEPYVDAYDLNNWTLKRILSDFLHIKDEEQNENLLSIISNIQEDEGLKNNLISAFSDSNNLSEALTRLSQNRHLRRLINFYQQDKAFNTLKRDVFQVSLVKDVERCVINHYPDLPELFNETRYELISDFLSDDKACSADTSDIIWKVIHNVRNNAPEVKAELNSYILTFIDDILWVEKEIMNKTKEDKDSFLYAYDLGLQGAIGEITEGAAIDIYRYNKVIATVSKGDKAFEDRQYTDNSLPDDVSGKVPYYLTVRTNCGQMEGSKGYASIDPKIKDGEKVDLTVDLSLRVKEDIDEAFVNRLDELLTETPADEPEDYMPTAEDLVNEDGISFDVLKDEETISLEEEIEELRKAAEKTSPCEVAKRNFRVAKASLTKNPRIEWSHAAYSLAELAYEELLSCEAQAGVRHYLEKDRNVITFMLAKTIQDNRSDVEPAIQSVFDKARNKAQERFATESENKSDLAALREQLPENLTFDQIIQSENLKTLIKFMGDPEQSDEKREQMRENFKMKEESHALDQITLRIYNLDDPETAPKEFTVNTDIFGEALVPVGELTSGVNYEIEVLAGDYFIPEFRSFKIERGQRSGDSYKATVPFHSEGRYGNFKTETENLHTAGIADRKSEKIDRKDLIAWVQLANSDPEAANIDAEPGLNLSDLGFFRKNLGATTVESIGEEDIDVQDIITILTGIPLTESRSIGTHPVSEEKTAPLAVRDIKWLKWVKEGCNNCYELEGGKVLFTEDGISSVHNNRCVGSTLVEYSCLHNDTLVQDERGCSHGCSMGQCETEPEADCIGENQPVPLTAPGYEQECCEGLSLEPYEATEGQPMIVGLKGYCRKTTESLTRCEDSDGGNDIYLKGTVTAYTPEGGNVVVQEYCVDANRARQASGDYLEEFVCLKNDPTYAYEHVFTRCPEGSTCKDGACTKTKGVADELSANAGEDQVLTAIQASGASVLLDPSASTGDIQWREWYRITDGKRLPISAPLKTLNPISPLLPIGEHEVFLTVSDGTKESTDSIKVTVLPQLQAVVKANEANVQLTPSHSETVLKFQGEETMRIVLDATESKGDALSCEWQAWEAPYTSGSTFPIADNCKNTLNLAPGKYLFYLTLNSHNVETAHYFYLTLDPGLTIDAGPDRTVEATGLEGAEVNLDLTLSKTGGFRYYWSDGSTVLGREKSVSPTLSCGEHLIKANVYGDKPNEYAQDSVKISVVDSDAADPHATIKINGKKINDYGYEVLSKDQDAIRLRLDGSDSAATSCKWEVTQLQTIRDKADRLFWGSSEYEGCQINLDSSVKPMKIKLTAINGCKVDSKIIHFDVKPSFKLAPDANACLSLNFLELDRRQNNLFHDLINLSTDLGQYCGITGGSSGNVGVSSVLEEEDYGYQANRVSPCSSAIERHSYNNCITCANIKKKWNHYDCSNDTVYNRSAVCKALFLFNNAFRRYENSNVNSWRNSNTVPVCGDLK